MNNYTKLRVKAISFWNKHSKKILIIIIVILVIIMVNRIIKSIPEPPPVPIVTYEKHVSVLTDEEVPKEYQEPIETTIDTYFNYCNSGEYEKAYNLITEDCRKNLYPTLSQFTEYINDIFEGKNKIYTIQSYSRVDNSFVYEIRILDDILANGTTDGYYYYKEKFILTEENGNMRLSIGNYVGDVDINTTVEDEYLEVKVIGKSVEYDTETYTVMFRNKTDKDIVILDNDQSNEVVLDFGDTTCTPINYGYSKIWLHPGTTTTKRLIFSKYYDNGRTAKQIKFGAIRVLNSYDVSVGTTQEVLDGAVRLYGLTIDL